MDVYGFVEKRSRGWMIRTSPKRGRIYLRMGGFPTMKQAIFVGNSVMRKLGWKLTEPWIKN